MDITLLYDNAYEMLAETNVYSRPPEQLVYHDHRGEKYALLELVRSHPMIGSRRMSSDKRSGVKINNAKCYQAIAEAMVKYADSYPAPSSFKKRMRENFVRWLEAIRSKYEFPEWPEIPWGLYPEDGEKDTVVGMLQSLQSRRGVTKEELQVRLGIGPRAILKDLCKLDPTLREDGTEEQENPLPFYIGGQPVRVRIRSKKYAGDRKKYYLTENSSYMIPDFFYINNRMTVPLEGFLRQFESYDDFEKQFSEEFLNEDARIGRYLGDLLYKYDKKASVVSFDAHLNHSYVGNIVNFKKNNPSRDALISIAFALGATEEELQYLLKYAGHAPLYVRRKRDVIIWFGIMKGESLESVNDALLARSLAPLYRDK